MRSYSRRSPLSNVVDVSIRLVVRASSQLPLFTYEPGSSVSL